MSKYQQLTDKTQCLIGYITSLVVINLFYGWEFLEY